MWDIAYANETERTASSVILIHKCESIGDDQHLELILAKAKEGKSGDDVIFDVSLHRDYKTIKAYEAPLVSENIPMPDDFAGGGQ